MYKESLNTKLVRKGFKANSFESLEATLSSDGDSLSLVTIYRPPPSRQNQFSDKLFLSEFAAFLESRYETKNLVIVGDFSVHWDNAISWCRGKDVTVKFSIGLFRSLTSNDQENIPNFIFL